MTALKSEPRIRDWIYDQQHPLRSPLLGKLVSATVCGLGHRICIMSHKNWDKDWIACRVCGARFLPADAIDDDTEIVKI